MGIYGLAQGQEETFPITDYYNEDLHCANAAAHVGHGTTSGCSVISNSTQTNGAEPCSNELTFTQNPEHWGLLEYFQFEPVGPMNAPECFALPIHHVDDYQWRTPSPWDTQENFVNPGGVNDPSWETPYPTPTTAP